tara:strand:+ start:359 stop:532 length:174 start_codon:yes stop_codon:yes gene_type:complete
MPKFTHLSYQQSDEDYQADFDYNQDNYYDKSDYLECLIHEEVSDNLSKKDQLLIDNF